jgi:hypothetical protein
MNGLSDSLKPNEGRRSFIWKTGAAVSAMAASAVAGFSKSTPNSDAGTLANKIGCLEDANVIRKLHGTYESCLDKGMYEEVAGMFTEDAEAVYNGGLFAGKQGIRRLFCDHFATRQTGKRIEPAPGLQPEKQEEIEVAPDRKTAKAKFHFSMQVGEPMEGDSSLLQMARLQGGGILKWWEGGTCEASYVKIGESWMIKRLEYRAVSKADYRPGQTFAKPIEVQAFSSVFPKNPTGPDKLIQEKQA